MRTLPKGYYAIQSDLEHASKETFLYRGIRYSVTLGVNLFPSLQEACKYAVDIPAEVLEGLPYEAFSTPVLLFSEGRHSIDRFRFPRSLTLLGECAGINPNVFSQNPQEPPALHPLRREKESLLWGSYWWGTMTVDEKEAETIIMDGFSSEYARFQDLRTQGGSAFISIRNIIHISPCGNTLYHFAALTPDCTLDRQVLLQNIRITDYDDLDYGGNFTLLSAHRAVLDGICYDTTGQIFGLTTIARDFPNCAAHFDSCEYQISNCYFRNLEGENAVSMSCHGAENLAVHLTVSNSSFVNASRKDQAPLRPHLAGPRSTLSISRCRFFDTRNNKGPAVLIMGQGTSVELNDCTFQGFAETWTNEPALPTQAPDFIQTGSRDFVTSAEDAHLVLGKDAADFTALDALYEGTRAYYGDLHVHTACGGTSDGKYPMTDWPKQMDVLQLDFAAVVDHRQMRGFFLPEWNEERFIIGTEPSTGFSNLRACRHNQKEVHYNMLFPHKYGLAMVLANFPEFEFHGD